MAEVTLNHLGAGRSTRSALERVRGDAVHPITLEVLRERRYDITGLCSNSWNESTAAGAPAMDFICTVCNQAAGEECPAWPGQPVTAH